MEATGVEVVDGEGDVDVCLQGNLQGVRSDLPLGIGEVVCDWKKCILLSLIHI